MAHLVRAVAALRCSANISLRYFSPCFSTRAYVEKRDGESSSHSRSYEESSSRGGFRNRENFGRDDSSRPRQNQDSYGGGRGGRSSGGSSFIGKRTGDSGRQQNYQRGGQIQADYSCLNAELKYSDPPKLEFNQVTALNQTLRDALEKNYGYKDCTSVQSAILSRLPCDADMIVQARTGTGKTLSYLLPAVNRILERSGENNSGSPSRVLVVAPTRELALQVAEEARRLLRGLRRSVVCLVGGDSRMRQFQALERGETDVLVGTPGRLIDFLENDQNFKTKISGVGTIVLDEADRMLEIGFKEAVVKLVSVIPQEAQRLMFSATYPRNVEKLVSDTMRKGYVVLNTVSPDEASTAENVRQTYVVCDMIDQMAHLHNILSRGRTMPSFKAMVFVPTTRAARMYGDYFAQAGFEGVLTLHSDKDQKARSSAAAAFRSAKSATLFTTDVSARGVDYPGVDLVIQIGMPTSPEQYVHRIGRTGRAGNTGEALAFLAPFEAEFIKELAGLPLLPGKLDDFGRLIIKCLSNTIITVDGKEGETSDSDKNVKDMVTFEKSKENILRIKLDSVLADEVSRYFSATVGFYASHLDFFKKTRVEPRTVTHSLANFIKLLGVSQIPRINPAINQDFQLRTSDI